VVAQQRRSLLGRLALASCPSSGSQRGVASGLATGYSFWSSRQSAGDQR
jgi:hypothetical protein